ncbi:hypothetical protein [Vibrio gallaecicus]|uniref:hypothetical protein n=1 Tax=Vibrio gallaecicus TaxID=552386 RepID=UPI0025B47EA9|nr:hypothetical protein [Vibrio gallaecicus]MDN3615864.1 hypothetical protein [Vibrio gallaecicus]
MNGTSVNLPFHTLSNSLDVHLVIALTQFCPNFLETAQTMSTDQTISNIYNPNRTP